MRRRNLYLVLGISPDASQETIRSAYRTLAKQYHPDHIGPRGAPRFHEITEAYRVLSNPETRRTHNDELDFATRADVVPEPLATSRRAFAEPLIPEPLSLRRGFHFGRPSIEDEFVDWTMSHLTQRHLPKSGTRRAIRLEVVLAREEADRGGVLPIDIPTIFVCRFCEGRGWDWFSPCDWCGGDGVEEGRRTLRFQIPPLVLDGSIWIVPLLDAGLDLRICIRVDPFG